MRCPACKTQNRDGSLLCERCGRSLTADASPLDDAPRGAAPAASSAATAPPEAAGHSSLSMAPAPISGSAESSLAGQFPSTAPTAPANMSTAAHPPAAALDTRQYADGAVYKPSGKSAPGASPLLFGTALGAGLLMGVLYFVVTLFINLIVVFPLVAGVLAGVLLASAINKGKVRNTKLSFASGLACGLLVVLTSQVLGAAKARSEMVEGLTAAFSPTTYIGKDKQPHQMSAKEIAEAQNKVRPMVESGLTPLRTLMLYEQLRARAGSELKHNGVGTGTKISGNAFWALRGLEALLLIGACIATAGAAASKPFCENCDTWHTSTDVLKIHPSQNALLWPQIEAQNWSALLATPPGKDPDSKNQTTLTLTSCPSCNHGTIAATSVGGKVPKEFVSRRLSPEATRELVQPRPAPTA